MILLLFIPSHRWSLKNLPYSLLIREILRRQADLQFLKKRREKEEGASNGFKRNGVICKKDCIVSLAYFVLPFFKFFIGY